LARQKDVPLFVVGLVFASFSFTAIPVAPWIGKHLERIGRRNGFVLSFLISFVGAASWSLLPFLGFATFILISFIGRMIMGMGNTACLVIGTTIAASDYPDKVGKILSYMESSGGLGMISGPLIGAGLFYATGFSITFAIYSAIFLLCAPVFFIILGKDRQYVNE
jgi:MFS family permease